MALYYIQNNFSIQLNPQFLNIWLVFGFSHALIFFKQKYHNLQLNVIFWRQLAS